LSDYTNVSTKKNTFLHDSKVIFFEKLRWVVVKRAHMFTSDWSRWCSSAYTFELCALDCIQCSRQMNMLGTTW